MPRPQSNFALAELKHLDLVSAQTKVIMSFEERQSVHAAAWAVQKFGGQVLVDRVARDYHEQPERDTKGQPIALSELSDSRGVKLKYQLEEAEMLGQEIAADLQSGFNRIQRGYPVQTITVRGATDAAAVLGSLERAVEVDPANLSASDQYHQAVAGYMLDHMQVFNAHDNDTVSYLL